MHGLTVRRFLQWWLASGTPLLTAPLATSRRPSWSKSNEPRERQPSLHPCTPSPRPAP